VSGLNLIAVLLRALLAGRAALLAQDLALRCQLAVVHRPVKRPGFFRH